MNIPLPFVVTTVCDICQMPLEDIRGRTKHARVVEARALIVYAARTLTTAAFPGISRAIGRSNHSTAVTAHHRFLRHAEEGKPYWHAGREENAPAGEVAAWVVEAVTARRVEFERGRVSVLGSVQWTGSYIKPWEREGAML